MKIEDLHILTAYEEEPLADRLRLLLQASIEQSVTAADDADDRIEQLAEELGYVRSNIVRIWLSGQSRIPLYQLPKLAEYIGVPLSILTAFWLGREVEAEQAEAIYQDVRPKVTDDEMKLIRMVRETYLDPVEVEVINR